ncbi:MAG: LPS assembly protein LptD [Elusimicrobia bacterium]|nr:LPS assembly protein LptD [Elusimicrobiota bacterium]
MRVKDSTYTLKGDELWIDTARRRGRSEGHLFVDDGVSAVSGASGDFDFDDHSGRLFNASAGYGDWRVHARSMVLDENRRLYYSGARFTSCDYVPPHYHFYASRVTVVPGKYMLGRNVVYFLGKVPLFYTPLLYKSLAKTHFLRFRLQPGYDHRNGAFLKSTLNTQHSEAWRSKLFLDYYSNEGFGSGGELIRRQGEDSRGILSAYHIRESREGDRRWAVNGDLYQAFASSFALQGHLQAMSDPRFNNDYSRASLLPVASYLSNSGALVYRLPQATARLSYNRQDNAVSTRTFVKSSEDTPRLEVQSVPLRLLGLPWLNTLSGFAVNNYDRSRGFTQNSVGGAWEVTRSFRLARGLSFTPRASYSETWYDWDNALTATTATVRDRDAAVGRYLAAGTLRLRSRAGDTDLTHTYARRLESDSFDLDAGAVDYGVEANLFALTHTYRPASSILARVGSGYDFRGYRDRAVGFHESLQPIQADLIFTPRPDFNLTLRNDYLLGTGNRNTVVNGTWGDELRTFVSAGVGYNRSEADRYYLNTEFGWTNSSGTLHLGGALRSSVRSPGGIDGLRAFYVFDREAQIVRRWHDFYTKLACRFRPGNVKEVSVRIEMKFGGYDSERQKVHDWESEWFPERRQGREERP